MCELGGSPWVVVVIPTAGRPTLLKRTLESIQLCQPPAIPARIIVVENGPKGSVEEIVRNLAPGNLPVDYEYIEHGNKSAALNFVMQGLDDADIIVFTDDDIRVGTQWLTSIEQFFSSGVKRVFGGGPVAIDYEVRPPDRLLRYLPMSARGVTTQQYAQMIKDDKFEGFLGCNWAVRVGDLRSVGEFSIEVGPGTISTGQETEMQRRLMTSGMQPRVLDEAEVWHYVPQDRCSEEWVLQRVGKTARETQSQVSGHASSRYRLMLELARNLLRIGLHRSAAFFRRDAQRRFHHQVAIAICKSKVDYVAAQVGLLNGGEDPDLSEISVRR